MSSVKKLPPDPARLIEGLRDTGYEFVTALADVVDNSVDAGATKIDVSIEMDSLGEILVSVSDNGCGMSEIGLLEGMKYGSAGRNDPKRLGKFGLGLKTGSTAFCRRLSVITRSNADEKPRKAIWDLDHVVRQSEWELLMEEPDLDEIDLLDQTANSSSGTVVIWEKVDRLIKEYSRKDGSHARKALDKRIQNFREHASMIFQRFLDPTDDRAKNIQLTVNGSLLSPWDPFCKSEPYTELVAEKTKSVEWDESKTGSFTIRAYVLPRKEEFSTEGAAKEAKIENSYQGIYIYRENRLIHPHDWLDMWAKEPHFTLLRVEFSFLHDLDDALQVDIKKSKILLDDTLYKWIRKEFLPPARNAAEQRSRKGQNKKAAETSQGAHASSNRNISSKELALKKADVTILDRDSGKVEIRNKSGVIQMKLTIKDSTQPDQVCVVPVEELEYNQLWKPAIIDQHHAVLINTSHPYYHKVYLPNLTSGVTVQGLDSLLWSLIEAELGTISPTTQQHFEELRFEVSRILHKLVADLPDPELE